MGLGLTRERRNLATSTWFFASNPSSSAASRRCRPSITNGRTVRSGIGSSSNSLPQTLRRATCLGRVVLQYMRSHCPTETHFSSASPSARLVATDEPG
jgi:hypothetical protein